MTATGLSNGVARLTTYEVLVVDNYDSFTFNLVQAVGAIGASARAVRADALDFAALEAAPPMAIVISPGPGTPERAGLSVEFIRAFSGRVPILGVCLGHQAIAVAFGGKVVRAPEVVHGKTSSVAHGGAGSFYGIPSPFAAGRYHSLVVDEPMLPACLRATARSADGLLMAMCHESHPTFGVQFHPESVLTAVGPRILANFLALAESHR